MHISAQYFRVRFIRSARTVQIFHGVGGKAWNISPKAQRYNRVFLVSEYDRRRFVNAGIFPENSPALEVIGMPKVDCLVNGTLRQEPILESLGLSPEVPTLLYAPTWQHTSSLYKMGRELIAELASGPWNLIVKLHDNCYRPTETVNWERETLPFRARPNVRIVRQPDISPFLIAADLLISDLSSTALEYLLCDRPVIVADAPDLFARYAADEVSRWQREIGPLLRDPAEATALVRHALEHPEEFREVRQRIARTVFYDPGRATERAVASLYRLLGL